MPQVAYTAEPDGASDYLNTRWQQYTGKALEDGLGAHWVDFVHPDDREHASARWGQALRPVSRLSANTVCARRTALIDGT